MADAVRRHVGEQVLQLHESRASILRTVRNEGSHLYFLDDPNMLCAEAWLSQDERDARAQAAAVRGIPRDLELYVGRRRGVYELLIWLRSGLCCWHAIGLPCVHCIQDRDKEEELSAWVFCTIISSLLGSVLMLASAPFFAARRAQREPSVVVVTESAIAVSESLEVGLCGCPASDPGPSTIVVDLASVHHAKLKRVYWWFDAVVVKWRHPGIPYGPFSFTDPERAKFFKRWSRDPDLRELTLLCLEDPTGFALAINHTSECLALALSRESSYSSSASAPSSFSSGARHVVLNPVAHGRVAAAAAAKLDNVVQVGADPDHAYSGAGKGF